MTSFSIFVFMLFHFDASFVALRICVIFDVSSWFHGWHFVLHNGTGVSFFLGVEMLSFFIFVNSFLLAFATNIVFTVIVSLLYDSFCNFIPRSNEAFYIFRVLFFSLFIFFSLLVSDVIVFTNNVSLFHCVSLHGFTSLENESF